MTDTDQLDRERIAQLSIRIMQAVRNNYIRGPQSRDRVFEALNALVIVTCTVIKGCDEDTKAVWFFQQAMTQQMGATDE